MAARRTTMTVAGAIVPNGTLVPNAHHPLGQLALALATPKPSIR